MDDLLQDGHAVARGESLVNGVLEGAAVAVLHNHIQAGVCLKVLVQADHVGAVANQTHHLELGVEQGPLGQQPPGVVQVGGFFKNDFNSEDLSVFACLVDLAAAARPQMIEQCVAVDARA